MKLIPRDKFLSSRHERGARQAANFMTGAEQNSSRGMAGLRAGELHVWLSFTEGMTAVDELFFEQQLSEAERMRAEKIVFPGGRLEFALARALLRGVLSRYHPVDPAAWRFAYDLQGKPFISGPADAPRLQFSVTHTRGLVACAVALDSAVGVDAEHLEARDDLLAVARQFLGVATSRELENLSGDALTLRFCEQWARQEAWAKAVGSGLAALPMSAENAAGWQFFQRQVSPRHILTAAVRRGNQRPAILKVRTAVWRRRNENLDLAVNEAGCE